ncbi:hypothetical protein ABZ485_28195 [Streptomyces albogriseolus]|uniref:hypothetical protein n=1 Tax=Streptomyces albogriseolus TaxID=1887 RepID=UPI0034608A7C
MTSPSPDNRFDDEFHSIITGGGYTDPNPYGTPAPQQVKTGLTPRGKAALGAGTCLLACGALFGWQQYAAQQANANVKTAELALQQQQIELEKLKEINRANAIAEKQNKAESSENKKHIDACIRSNEKLVGKIMGVTYQSVRDDCQAAYQTASDSPAMETASSTGSDDDGLGAGVLVGVAALFLVGGTAAKKLTKSSPA